MEIKLQNIHKSYEEAGNELIVLKDLTINFPSNQSSIIIGNSGSGKSTILNLISGIDTPETGRIKIGKTLINELKDQPRTLFRRRHIGFIFQFFNLIPTLNVLENVTLILELEGHNQNTVRSRAIDMLEAVGLASRLKTMPDRLSGGEQQRVAIARALSHNPDVILADEPTGNLDEESGKKILTLLVDMVRNQGKTLVMVTHSNDALTLADNVFSIKKRKLECVNINQ